MKISKSKVIKQMVKNGSNPKEAEQRVNNNYNYVARTYGKDISLKQFSEILMTVACL